MGPARTRRRSWTGSGGIGPFADRVLAFTEFLPLGSRPSVGYPAVVVPLTVAAGPVPAAVTAATVTV